tara:strand:- start:673 stop:951 length:279 start_codon:yes stop_codon:yes gene_type:complete
VAFHVVHSELIEMYEPKEVVGQVGWSWDAVREARNEALVSTDLWYLKDRWDNLSSTAKGQLNSYRESLRDLPQNYSTPDEAVENWPEREDWF